MKIFVAGATGVLGRRLVARLTDREHEVVGLVRDEAGGRTVREAGGEPVRGDLLQPETVERGMPVDVDAVVHAATAIPTDTKTTREDWATNDRLRREGTETLATAAADAGADRYVQQSVVWVARQPDGSAFDEDSDPNPDAVTESALDGERLARRRADEADMDVVVLRGGWFYGHDAAQTRQMGENLLARRLPILGGGVLGREDATVSLLHLDDAAAAYVAALEGEGAGVYHVVDDRPVTVADFFDRFSAALNAPRPLRVPAWLARPFVGNHTVRFLTSSMPTRNDRFRAAFDWEPEHPTYREGIDRIVDRWKAGGTIEAVDGDVEWTG